MLALLFFYKCLHCNKQLNPSRHYKLQVFMISTPRLSSKVSWCCKKLRATISHQSKYQLNPFRHCEINGLSKTFVWFKSLSWLGMVFCTTIHRYSIVSKRYSVVCKVYTGSHGTSKIEHGLCACTVDNPLAKALGLSLRTSA